jgi:CRP/FNR family cyclic AMP-dependent transcriptional regulator
VAIEGVNPVGDGQDEKRFLSAQEVERLAASGVKRTFPRHAVLINEGERSEHVYVILSGQVKVFCSDDAGREITLNFMGPGEFFGELSVISETPRSASVMTTQRTTLSLISRDAFRSYLADNPEIAYKFLRLLAVRVRDLTELAKNLALNDVYGRVTRTLLQLAEERDGVLVVKQKLTHQEIANLVGASREMVSRIMKELVKGGYVEVRQRVITIRGRFPKAW